MKRYTFFIALFPFLFSIPIFSQHRTEKDARTADTPNFSKKYNTLIIHLLHLQTNWAFAEKEREFDNVLNQPLTQKKIADLNVGAAQYTVKLANMAKDSDYKEYLYARAKIYLSAAAFHSKWAGISDTSSATSKNQYMKEYNDTHWNAIEKLAYPVYSNLLQNKYDLSDFWDREMVKRLLLPNLYSSNASTDNKPIDYYKNFRPDNSYFKGAKNELLNVYLSQMSVDPVVIKYFELNFIYNISLYLNDISIDALPIITDMLIARRIGSPIAKFFVSALVDYIGYKLKTNQNESRTEVFKYITQVLQKILKEVDDEVQELKRLEDFAVTYYNSLKQEYLENKDYTDLYFTVNSTIPLTRYERQHFQNYLLTEIGMLSLAQNSLLEDVKKDALSNQELKWLEAINSFRKANNLKLMLFK